MLTSRHAFLPLLLSACAAQQPAPSTSTATGTSASTASAPPSPFGPARLVKSRDGRFDGELTGTPAPGGKFSKLTIGMTMSEVTSLIGGPDNLTRHETGKRWIPFYFGSDAQRVQVLYRGEGCLTYTGGNVFGGGATS